MVVYRDIKRAAVAELAETARTLMESMGGLGDMAPAERKQWAKAYEELAEELERRAGLRPAKPKTIPIDPNQEVLFP